MTRLDPPVPAPRSQRRSTGNKRLDQLLGGGLPVSSKTLITGPAFAGKRAIWQRAAMRALRDGRPLILLITDSTPAKVRGQFEHLDPSFLDHEQSGKVRYVDAYSNDVGGATAAEGYARVVDGPHHLDAILEACDQAREELVEGGTEPYFVIDSLSTLLLSNEDRAVHSFLRRLLGRHEAAQGATLMSAQPALHPGAQSHLLKHLADVVIELQEDAGERLLRVEGPSTAHDRVWIEYAYGGEDVEITGSVNAARIV